ncbi:hypothetical protein [Clostridium sp.]|uniref:hypothetical protein n=1 Tax=Clostridium sp. TaxID=1506 RepID=UPI003F2C29D1
MNNEYDDEYYYEDDDDDEDEYYYEEDDEDEDEYYYEDDYQDDPIVKLAKLNQELGFEDKSITGNRGEYKQFDKDENSNYQIATINSDKVEKYSGTVDENELVITPYPKEMAIDQINVLNDNSTNNTYYHDPNLAEEIRQMKEEIKNIKDILVVKTKEDKQKEELYNKVNDFNSFMDQKVSELNNYKYSTSSYKQNEYVQQLLKNFMNKNKKLKKQEILNVAILMFLDKFNY